MQNAEFTAMCHGVKHGEKRFIEDRQTRKAGRVISCSSSGHLDVEFDGEKTTLPATDCRERWDLQPKP